MRSIVALCVLLAVANALPPIPDPVASLKKLDWAAPQRHANTFDKLGARVAARDTTISDLCLQKYANFVLSPCFGAVRTAFVDNSADFNPEPFCTSNCSTIFSDMMATCDQSWALNDTASGFAMITDLMCLKDGNKWCFNTFRGLENAFQAAPNAETLDNFCGPCVRKVVNVIASYGGLGQEGVRAARLALDILCLKDGDQYCWIQFQSTQFQNCFEGDDLSGESCLNLMCSDCFAKISTAMWLYYGADTVEGKMFATFRNFLCNKKDGKYCYTLFNEFAQSQGDNGGDAPTCPALKSATDSLGCCLGSVISFLQSSDNPASSQVASVFTQCGVTIPNACPRTGGKFRLAIHFSLTMPYVWADGHRDEIMQTIKNDIALFLGLSPDDIEITDIAPDSVARSSNTLVSLNLQGNSDTQTQSYQTAIQGAASSNTLSFPSTLQVYAQDYPRQPISATNVVVTQEEVSPASVVAVSSLLVAAGVMVALF